MIKICHNFLWSKAHISDKRFEGCKDISRQGSDGVYKLVSGCLIDNEKGIFDALETSVAAVTNINM